MQPLLLVVSLLLAVLCQTAVSFASEEKINVLDTVVVTPEKSEETTKNTPAAISVVPGQVIRESGLRMLGDALQWVPGFHVADVTGNGTQYWGSMRGMPAHNNRYYLVLLDGIPRNNYTDEFWWFTIPMEIVDRVEVLRGPSSALYGRCAMGGVINIITKKGGPERVNQLGGGYGSYDENRGQVSFSGQFGRLNYNLVGVHYGSKGWRETNNAYNQNNFFSRLGYDFDNDFSVTLETDYTYMDRDMTMGLLINDYLRGDRRGVFYKETDALHREFNAALFLEKGFGEQIRVINRAYYQNVNEDWWNLWNYYDKDDKGFRVGEELQWQAGHYLFDRKNEITVGFNYERQSFDSRRTYSKYHWNPARRGIVYRDAYLAKDYLAGYIQDKLTILPDLLAIVGGVRYDYVNIKFDDHLRSSSRTLHMDAVSPKGGLVFTPLPEINFYVNLGTGFRTPTNTDIASNPNLKPEKALNYEIGVRGLLFDRLYYQIAAYEARLTDQLIYMLSSTVGPYIDNAGKSRMQGIELELEAKLHDYWQAFFTYNYNYTKLLNFTDSFGGNFTGKTPPFQPRHKIGAGVKFEHPSGWKAMVSCRWFDNQFIAEDNGFRMPSYLLADLQVSYTYRKWLEAGLAVRNLFDRDYISYGEDWGGGEIYLTPGDPLTVLGFMKLNF